MRKRALALSLFLAAVFCLGAPVKILIKNIDSIPLSSGLAVQKISPVTAQTAGQTFVFNTKRNFIVGDSSEHLQGFVKMRGKKYPASATKSGDTLVINHPSRIRNRRQRMNTITVKLNLSQDVGKVKSIPNSLLENSSCAAKHEEHVNTHTILPLKEGMSENASLFATIHTFADAQFYVKYGDSSNTQILSYLNTVESIYSRQLGVRFSVVGQTILQEHDATFDASSMLSRFRTNPIAQNNHADLKHLFTGKDMSGSTVGIAYIGALCYAPNYAYGISQDYLNLGPLILAHELGHNFGANHTYSYGTIMYPSISPYAEGFSADSINAINGHLNQFGSCLDYRNYTPDLSKAELTIKRKAKRITGKLTDVFGEPIKSHAIVVVVNNRPHTKSTNDVGVYRHTLRKPKTRKKFAVYAKTVNGETTSKVLKFRF